MKGVTGHSFRGRLMAAFRSQTARRTGASVAKAMGFVQPVSGNMPYE